MVFFSSGLDIFKHINFLFDDFIKLPSANPFVRKIQKHISIPIKKLFYPDNTLVKLSYKAAKQKILLSSKQIHDILSSLAEEPFLFFN